MDLKDTLDRLVELAVEAAGPTVSEYSTAHLQVTRPAGDIAFVPKPLKPLNHHAADLRTIVDRLRFCAETAPAEDGPPYSSIWIDLHQIVALYWDDDNRHSIRCPLTFSEVYTALIDVNGKSLNQRDAVDFFYFTVGEYVATEVSDLLRSINFTLENAGAQTLQRDRESLGASVTKTLTAATAIPKWVNLTIPIYDLGDDPDTDQEFTIYLTPNVDQRTILLRLAPDALPRAERKAAEILREYLTYHTRTTIGTTDGPANETRPIAQVYRGRPY